MKKSLLALGAVAALGGLGFSGAAHAVWVVGDAADADAHALSVASDTGVGHILVTPYFSTAGNTGTLLSVVNTDTTNGKAVKVRFRGAANSDDILDFTVLLSPYDVWTASVSQGPDGKSRLFSGDTSCVLPGQVPADGIGFSETRLDQRLSAEALAAHTQEGYVEWLNMADIPPNSPLYKQVKHDAVTGKPQCSPDMVQYLIDPRQSMTVDQAQTYGLTAPTGGLMGNWSIYNAQNVTSYGGSNSAIVALDTNATPPAPAAARLFFAPQIGSNDPFFPAGLAWTGGSELGETADPLLTNSLNGAPAPATASAGIIPLLPFDLPDLSTPYVSGFNFAPAQSAALSASLATSAVMNEWTAGSSDGVNFSTDWVFSQPTRRYHAAVNYRSGSDKPVAAYNSLSSPYYYPSTTMTLKELGASKEFGSVLCLADNVATYNAYNREELTKKLVFGGEWSPGTPVDKAPGFCGEVAVLTFGGADSRSLNAKLTTYKVDNLPTGGAGWMSVGMPGVTTIGSDNFAGGLPVIGYAANTFNTSVGNMVGNYGDAITHRYKRPSGSVPAIVPVP